MKLRGRDSAAALAIVPKHGVLDRIERPRAPIFLTEAQAEEWHAVVDAVAADWFGRESHPLLLQYVRHAVASNRIAVEIENVLAAPVFDGEAYDALLKMQLRESRALIALATALRLSQQSAYDKTKKRQPHRKLPWEDND